MNNEKLQTLIGYTVLVLLVPVMSMASVESTLMSVQNKLVGTIMPLAAIIGLVIAGISMAVGNANAKSHMWYAILGAGIGFGAQSIIAFVRGMVG